MSSLLLLAATGSDSVDPSVAQVTQPGKTQEPVRVKAEREYTIPAGESVTTTTSTSRGFPDLIPTLIPALQSSSYVLVILVAFAAWSSRSLVKSFLERHLELMSAVKVSLEQERTDNEKHIAVLTQLTQTNAQLASSLDKSISNTKG